MNQFSNESGQLSFTLHKLLARSQVSSYRRTGARADMQVFDSFCPSLFACILESRLNQINHDEQQYRLLSI